MPLRHVITTRARPYMTSESHANILAGVLSYLFANNSFATTVLIALVIFFFY